ncbi:MAG TPA: hypothetical protein DDY68_00940 [Porphyromonadaceae bacterium]|nr:hypothetical protein [Porphyromonadaceae bacterium]
MENLADLLKTTKKNLEENLLTEKSQKLKTEEIAKQIALFGKKKIEPIIENITQVEKIVQCPYHVGFLGRYSHGKTAMLNALFKLDSSSQLPEGEGVVTSKVTYASFQHNQLSPCAYEVHQSGKTVPIDLETLRSRVGKSDYDTSSINFYKLDLPVEGNLSSFSSLFADKNINLVDMPGLGGPYFKDMEETKRYIREMDVLIVVIRMDEIEESGLVLNNLIGDYLSIPTISVLTFADKFESSKLFYDCGDNIEKAVAKSRTLIEQHIPNLRLSTLIAVSSKRGDNIDALRKLILSTVESSHIAISKAKKDISPVYRRRLLEFQKEYVGLKEKLENLSQDLETFMENIVPEKSTNRGIIDILPEVKKSTVVIRAERELDKEINRSVNEGFLRYKEIIESLRNSNESDYTQRLEKACRSSNDSIDKFIQDRVGSSYRSYCDVFYSEANRKISHLMLDKRTEETLQDDIKTLCDESQFDFSDLQIMTDQTVVSKYFSNYAKQLSISFLQSLIHDPISLLLIVVGLVAASFWPPLALISLCGIGKILIEQPNQRKKAFRRAIEDTINYLEGLLDPNELKSSLQTMKSTTLSDLNNDIKDALCGDIDPYNHDITILRNAKDNIDRSIEKLSSKLYEEICNTSLR